MVDEHLTTSLQVAVIAAMVYDQIYGTEIVAQIKTVHFDGVYRDFAAAVLKYRKTYHKPPGNEHLAELAAEARLRRDTRPLIDQLLIELEASSKNLNGAFIASRVGEFIRRQRVKTAVFGSSDIWEASQSGDVKALDKIEQIFRECLAARSAGYDLGVFLDDERLLHKLDYDDEEMIPLFSATSFEPLTQRRIGLYPKQMLLYIACKGSGKSWFCVNCGIQAITHHKKVVHYTLEMDGARMVVPRYFQSLWRIGRDKANYTEFTAEIDEKGEWAGLTKKLTHPQLSFDQPNIFEELRPKHADVLHFLKNLVVKTYPTSSATVEDIEAHLDSLADSRNFIPDVMIVDYPKLMKVNPDRIRIDIGHNVARLRGLAMERNLALLCPHQGTRKTIGAQRTRSRDAAEDISVVQTADTVITYQQTELEARHSLARISIEHARETLSRLMMIITQDYTIGQYATSGAIHTENYENTYVKGQAEQTVGEADDE